MESPSNYDNIRDCSISLLSRLRGKYVKVKLIKNQSRSGFLCAVDPEDYSIILLEESETILLPGHAVLGLSEIDLESKVEPRLVLHTHISEEKNSLLEEKQKLKSWFEKNLITISEDGDNLVFGNATILPPYNVTRIYSPNLSVVTQVRKIIESMPENFGGT